MLCLVPLFPFAKGNMPLLSLKSMSKMLEELQLTLTWLENTAFQALWWPIKQLRSSMLHFQSPFLADYSNICSILKKKHNAIAYHRVREAVAAKIIHFGHIKSEENLADILTKSVNKTTFYNLTKKCLFRNPDIIVREKESSWRAQPWFSDTIVWRIRCKNCEFWTNSPSVSRKEKKMKNTRKIRRSSAFIQELCRKGSNSVIWTCELSCMSHKVLWECPTVPEPNTDQIYRLCTNCMVIY